MAGSARSASAVLRGVRCMSRASRGRSLSSASVTEATPGPRLPEGNDPGAFHSREHMLVAVSRWRNISIIFGVPVLGFGILQMLEEHEHAEESPEYPYLKIASRSPRFPWGDDDLIGTPADRAKRSGGHH